jgi:hypothetical protein
LKPHQQQKAPKKRGFFVRIVVCNSTFENLLHAMSCCTISITIESEEISTMMDYERSLAIARRMDYHYNPGCCWANAVQALRLYYKQLGDMVYVEGWCAMPDISMVQEHGWLEVDGAILDPTYAVPDDDDQGQGVRPHYEYFPAVRYRLEELKGVRLRSLPRIWKTGGFGGLQNEAYYSAMNSAYQRIGYPLPVQQPGLREELTR